MDFNTHTHTHEGEPKQEANGETKTTGYVHKQSNQSPQPNNSNPNNNPQTTQDVSNAAQGEAMRPERGLPNTIPQSTLAAGQNNVPQSNTLANGQVDVNNPQADNVSADLAAGANQNYQAARVAHNQNSKSFFEGIKRVPENTQAEEDKNKKLDLPNLLSKPIPAANKNQVAQTLIKTDEQLEKTLTKGLPKKAYVYSTRGEYLGEWTTSKERGIFFIDPNLANEILDNPISHFTSYKTPLLHHCKFYIGEKTMKSIHQLWEKTKTENAEQGGLFHVGADKQLILEECDNCDRTTTSISDIFTTWDDSFYPVENTYVANIHTHPPNPHSRGEIIDNPNGKIAHQKYGQKYPSSVPPSDADYSGSLEAQRSRSKRTKSTDFLVGGLGLIAHQNGITIYKHTEVGESLPKKDEDKEFRLYEWADFNHKP